MRIGTKSLLAGAHCLLIHPLFVWRAWWRLFGVSWDPRIVCACFLHDIGYFGRDEIEGPTGDEHVLLGARLMGWLFGPEWARECLRHSRSWCNRTGLPVSRLGLADKLAFAITPAWLYIPMTRWSGELAEYMQASKERRDVSFTEAELRLLNSEDLREWLEGLQRYTLRWVKQQHAEYLNLNGGGRVRISHSTQAGFP
jgi:hypothetical protein